MTPAQAETGDSNPADLRSLAACLCFCATLLRYPDPAIHAALEEASPHFADLHMALLGCKQVPLPGLDRMQLSYTSLFVANPAGIPAAPYVSCRLEPDGQVYGEATVALRKMMASERVRPQSNLCEPEDHFGLVFDFAALLAERSAETPEKLIALQHVIDTYLSPLLPGFAADVDRAEPAGFYADATAFCSALIGNQDALFPLSTARSEY
jgi:TorA maturation chaperone TorD